MAASKLLCGMVLFLAVSGSMAQTQAQTNAIVASCGMPLALKMKPFGDACNKELAKATKCPSSCIQVNKLAKPAKCAAAVNAAVSKANKAKIAKICKPTGRKLM